MTHFHLTFRKTDCWAQQCSSVVQHSGMEEAGDQEFKDILSYIASWRSTWTTWKIISRKQKKELYSWFVVVSILEPSVLPGREAYFKASIQEGIQRSFNKVTNTEIPLPGCCDMDFKFAVHFWVQLQLKDDIGRFLRQLDQNQELSYYKRLRLRRKPP